MSNEIMSDDQIKTIVEGAFRPLHCVAEIDDYKAKLKFRVFDQGDPFIYQEPGWPLEPLRDKSKLESSLCNARAVIQGKGIPLEPWKMV